MEELINRIAADVIAAPKCKEVSLDTAKRYVKRVVTEVLIYCNREDIPSLMETIIASITEDMLQADLIRSPDKEVQSITRGDTSITYTDQSVKLAQAVNFIKDYKASLQHFRRPHKLRR